MPETVFAHNGSSLLAYVASRLRPEVFTHPIWVHFGDKIKPNTPGILEELNNVVKQLEDSDPDCSCQLLLICAVYQNYNGQSEEALRTIQQILSLAERQGLAKEIIWASWGACAICIQKGDLEQAAIHLQHLQSRLLTQNEWILANFIEIVEQSLPQLSVAVKVGGTESPQDQTVDGLMRPIFDWLQRWGLSALSPVPEFRVISHQLGRTTNQGAFSAQTLSVIQRLRRYWLTVQRAVRGEIKLQWVAKNAPFQTSCKMQPQILISPLSNSHQLDTSQSLSSQSLIHNRAWIKLADSPYLEEAFTGASLLVYCLGLFRVFQDEQPIDDWPSSKGKAIFKYLVAHRERPVFKDVLMELFWPDTSAESARNNLNVAVYGLRQALRKACPSFSHVLFIDDCYLLNPEMRIWLDYEAFLGIIKTASELERNGNLKAAIVEYSKAETLYQGEFLVEDRYENWLLPLRENLHMEYLNLLERLNHHFFNKQDFQACIHVCKKMLTIDPCNEEAHRHLMRCFFERGQSYLALRQYQLCIEALKKELNVAPTNGTKELYEYISLKS